MNLAVNKPKAGEDVNRYSVVSSNISTVGYDIAERVLEVEFKSGGVYQYSNVPEYEYKALLTASSLGAYLNKHILNVYQDKKIK